MVHVYNVNVSGTEGLVSPAELRREFPMDDALSQCIYDHRRTIQDILTGKDPRFMLIVGPCSIYDKASALEFAKRLKVLADRVSDSIFIVMRTFFAKPRSTIGWKGLIYDPGMNGSYNVNEGIRISRDIALSIARLGLPIATEMLDAFTIEPLSDIISWAAIGARTAESQTHRETASGLSSIVGIKNSTDGHVKNAIDGVEAVNAPHHFWGVRPDGKADYIPTLGNKFAHVVLRGGRHGPNFDQVTVSETLAELERRGLLQAVVIDCSHGNSGKDFRRQPAVLQDVIDQRLAGQVHIVGGMLESNLTEGSQKIPQPFNPDQIVFGQSITDSCLGWEETEQIILDAHEQLAGSRIAV